MTITRPVRRGGQTYERAESDWYQEPAWTVFITGPRVREWGFQTPEGWRPWHEVTEPEQPVVQR